MKNLLILLFLVAFPVVTCQAEISANLHSEVSQCLRDGDTICSNDVCLSCHTSPPDEAEMYSTGDIGMCSFCHEQESTQTEGGALLVTHGGNHSSQVAYEPWKPGSDLHENPVGPKLYCESSGSNCMMLCSTCHDPHADTPGLLRVENRGSVLCLSCHGK
jgi:predicted CXXCH cytochrome family protein